jgi:hypothetical protein
MTDIKFSEEHYYMVYVGHVCIGLTEEEYKALKNDPIEARKFVEEEAGPLDLILEHERLDRRVRCCAVTKAGSQCKNYVGGAYYMDFEEWRTRRESSPMCWIHANATLNISEATP